MEFKKKFLLIFRRDKTTLISGHYFKTYTHMYKSYNYLCYFSIVIDVVHISLLH